LDASGCYDLSEVLTQVGEPSRRNGGTELNTTSNVYDLDFRNYDPALARLNQVDELADKYSSATPYNFALNNPASQNDPTGLWMNPALWNSMIAQFATLVSQIKLADNSGGSGGGFDPKSFLIPANLGISYQNGVAVPGGDINFSLPIRNNGQSVTGPVVWNPGINDGNGGYVDAYWILAVDPGHQNEAYRAEAQAAVDAYEAGSNWQSIPQDPLQDSHGLPVYTMDQFLAANKGKSYFSIINQSAVRNGLPGGPKMRMVRNPRDGNIMDMRHVMVVGFGFGEEIGYLFEYTQEVRGMGQAFNGQDLYSNAIGDDFVKEYLMIGGYVKDWSTTFYNYLNRGLK
jgi:RHS repeat-associated protein